MGPDAPLATLISIRPVHLERILDGRKTVELRRVAPCRASNGRLIFYASSPERRIRAVALLADLVAAPIVELWQKCGASSAISESEFRNYFAGCSVGYGLILREPRAVQPFPCPIRPPQSFAYLFADVPAHLMIVSRAGHLSERSATVLDYSKEHG